ncbi:BQ5605_C001g00029 [Microbotryum silenes-dioicae]|uniref:BQ5605_C001g00026 protein n=1 Tax=Microbotryum silenes-dioicae TaxID=796604 RepID=A0A2X0M5L9_9BASI|nr:BQ5605_C001g00026 [Microbotryum silenes-dioicae]SGY43506.1 BQ5605_C001g00029 [Microbotryum silenes-dioicae]
MSSATTTGSRDKFGSFESPITLDLVLGSFIGLSMPLYNQASSSLYWLENRPSQKGRNALAQLLLPSATSAASDAKFTKIEVLPDEKWNARSRVHEYGGGSYATLGNGGLVFEHVEGGSWVVEPKAEGGEWQQPKRVTKESKVDRYADFSSAHPRASSLILAVHEDHTIDEPAKVVNNIVLMDTSIEATPKVVVAGADFYSNGKYVSWIEWYMPDMPWEGSLLCVAPVRLSDDKKSIEVNVAAKQVIAGQVKNVEAVSQARWAENEDRLVFLCDRTGYNELYQWTEGKEAKMVLAEPTAHDVGLDYIIAVPGDVQNPNPSFVRHKGNNFSNRTKRSAAMGLFFSVGNSGGIVSSMVYFKQDAPRFIRGQSVGLGFTLMALVLSLGLTLHLGSENRAKDAKYGPVQEGDEEFEQLPLELQRARTKAWRLEGVAPQQLSDLAENHPAFRYVT